MPFPKEKLRPVLIKLMKANIIVFQFQIYSDEQCYIIKKLTRKCILRNMYSFKTVGNFLKVLHFLFNKLKSVQRNIKTKERILWGKPTSYSTYNEIKYSKKT
jgi:hypothetical protein